MTEIFKEKDRVYHILNGFGVVEEFTEKNTRVLFDNNVNSWVDTRLLSFTEYTLNGFSQERPITLPEVGELCMFCDGEDRTWIVKEFIRYNSSLEYPYITKGDIGYRLMKRIKILD
jgi:hypothetical protein